MEMLRSPVVAAWVRISNETSIDEDGYDFVGRGAGIENENEESENRQKEW